MFKFACSLLLALFLSQPLQGISQTTYQITYRDSTSTRFQDIIRGGDFYYLTGSTRNVGRQLLLQKQYLNGKVAWSKSIGSTGSEFGKKIRHWNDTLLVAGYSTGHTQGAADPGDAYFMKLDSSGAVQVCASFGGSQMDQAMSLIRSSDNFVYLAGFTESFGAGGKDMLLIKTDLNGQFYWARSIGTSSGEEVAYSLLETLDGDLVLAGYSEVGSGVPARSIFLAKMSPNGDLRWNYFYDVNISSTGNEYQTAYDLIQDADGNLLIAGNVKDFDTPLIRVPIILKTDSTGSILQSTGYFLNSGNSAAYSILPASNGYLLGGRMGNNYPMLVKVDDGGNTEWSWYFSGTGFSTQGEGLGLAMAPEGDYALAGYYTPTNGGDTLGYLIKTDLIGSTGCNQGVPDLMADTTAFTAQQISSPVVVDSGGSGLIHSPTTFSNSILESVFCIMVGQEEPQAGFELRLGPNPAGSFINLELTRTNPAAVSANIFDSRGIKVKTFELEAGSGYSNTSVDLEGLAGGMYILQLQQESKRQNLRFVIQR